MGYQNQVEAVAELGSKCYRERAELTAEVARLRAALTKANDQAEHFEREWYLRGDEIERLHKFLEIWVSDGSLQTFEHREKFRAEAKTLLGPNVVLSGARTGLDGA